MRMLPLRSALIAVLAIAFPLLLLQKQGIGEAVAQSALTSTALVNDRTSPLLEHVIGRMNDSMKWLEDNPLSTFPRSWESRLRRKPGTPPPNGALSFGTRLAAKADEFLSGRLLLRGREGGWLYARYGNADASKKVPIPTLPNSGEGDDADAAPDISISLQKKGGERIAPPPYVVNETTGTLELQPQRRFRPGLYTITVTATHPTTGAQASLEQDFAWGVLAMNPDKDSYATGETAQIDFGVLDEHGDIVCDAELTLTVQSPSGARTTLTTRDGTIAVTGTCGIKKAGFIEPDYRAVLPLDEEGIYATDLVAITQNGAWTISVPIVVSNAAPFRIKRTAATRLWPFAPSSMNLKVHFSRDFTGTISDTVPEGFVILGSQPTSERKLIEDERGRGTRIYWHGTWKAGETAEFLYTYDAPDISPEFYLVGPATLTETNGNILHELRSWQIANDAVGWLSGWDYRKKISIDYDQVDSDLTDFPLYVKIDADTDIGDNALSTGYDLRFTSSTGMLLSYERESFAIASGEATGDFWVKVPDVNSTSTTDIYLYYGNADAADGEDATNVWTANFKGIYHLDGPNPDYLTDSTGNNNLTAYDAPLLQQTGQCYEMVDFRSWSTEGIYDSSWTGTLSGDFEISFWAEADLTGTLHLARSHNNGATDGEWAILYVNRVLRWYMLDSSWVYAYSDAAVSGFHHIVVYRESGTLKIDIDGVTQSHTASSAHDTQTGWFFSLGFRYGNSLGPDQWYDGPIDEFWLRDTTDANWRKFQYYNMIDVEDSGYELVLGGEETEAPPAGGSSNFFYFFGL